MTKNGGFGGFYVVISIHTALAGCDKGYGIFTRPSNISIHTALAGCDKEIVAGFEGLENFNPHSPRRL